jgi:hypothetical protein
MNDDEISPLVVFLAAGLVVRDRRGLPDRRRGDGQAADHSLASDATAKAHYPAHT